MRHTILTLILSLLFLCSCSDRNDRILSEIEAVMTSDPARAYSLRDSLDYNSLTRTQKADYAVMEAHMQAVLKYPFSNPERLDSAITYYSSQLLPDKKKLMVALHSKALYDFNNGSNGSSMNYTLQALDIAAEKNDNLWCGRFYTLLSDINQATLNIQEMRDNNHMAADCFRRVDSLGHYQYAVLGEALAISNLGEPEKGLALIDSMYAVMPYYSPATKNCANDYRAEMLRRSERSQDAYEVWSRIPRDYWACNIDGIVTFGNILIDVGRLDSCEVLVRDVVARGDSAEINHPDFLYLRYRLAKERGDNGAALDYYVRSSSTLYDMVKTMMGNSAMKYQGEFYKEQSARRKAEYEFRRKVYIGIIGLLAAATVVFIVYIHRKLKRRRVEIETLVDELSGLRAETARMTDEMGRMQREAETDSAVRESLESLRSDMASNLSRIIQTFGDTIELKNMKHAGACLRELRRYLNDDSRYAGIERNLDCITGGLFAGLRANVPRIRETDIRATMLQALGMSRPGIATFMGINNLTLYSNLYRLRKAVRSSGWERGEEFISLLRNGLDDEREKT